MSVKEASKLRSGLRNNRKMGGKWEENEEYKRRNQKNGNKEKINEDETEDNYRYFKIMK